MQEQEQKQNIPVLLEERPINADSYLNSKNNHWITVLNPLLYATYDLSLYAFRILMFTLTTVSSVNDDKLFVATISATKLSKIIEINSKNAYTLIEKACDELMDAKINIKDVDKDEWVKIHLMQYCYKKKGKVSLALSLEMSKYVLKLQKNFTKIPFFYINQLPSVYANRLFLLLYFHFMREYNQAKTPEAKDNCRFSVLYNVDYLYSFFLGENKNKKYASFGDFHKRVIKSSVKFINNSSLLDIKMSYRSESKATTAINFIVKNGEANKTYLETMQNNKEKRTTEEIERKTDGSAKAAVTYLRNIFHISEKVAKDIIAENDLKTIELKAICVFMQQFLDKKKMSHFFGLQDNDNEYLYYIDPDKIDYTIGHGMALLRIMANNKEEEISCKMLNYNKSLDYEANLQNIAFANSVNKQFEEVYNKHLQTIKELE